MTRKVQPVADYWTIDAEMKSIVQPSADNWTIDQKNLGTRLWDIFTSLSKENILNE